MRVRVKTYGPSRSGVALSRELGALRLRTPTRFRPRGDDVVINWGSSECDFPCRVINPAYNVKQAIDKLYSLSLFADQGVSCPPTTTSKERASEWIEIDGTAVVCRGLTRGSGGRGISIVSIVEELPRVPMYTQYIKKRDEYRVFVVAGRVVRVTQKRCRRGADPNYQVRNATNGWVYCQEDVAHPEVVASEASRAVQLLGLDFGAVDVGYNRHREQACVYEVNTAFGLEGTTLKVFADAIREEFL